MGRIRRILLVVAAVSMVCLAGVASAADTAVIQAVDGGAMVTISGDVGSQVVVFSVQPDGTYLPTFAGPLPEGPLVLFVPALAGTNPTLPAVWVAEVTPGGLVPLAVEDPVERWYFE